MDVIVDMIIKNAATGEVMSESSRKIVADEQLKALIEDDKRCGVYDRGLLRLELCSAEQDCVQDQIAEELLAVKKELDALLIAGNPQCVLHRVREKIKNMLSILGVE